MLRKWISVMWLCAVALIFGLHTLAIFVSHPAREILYFASFVVLVLAITVTLTHNKIKFGVFFPGARKNKP